MIDIVLVNWNSGFQLRDAVESIVVNHRNLVKKIIVVDNNSSDGSLDVLNLEGADLPFCIDIIRNKENLGFGAACNQGARVGVSEYILFLNPDAKLFSDSLSIPHEYMDQNSQASVGICGIQLRSSTGEIARSCSRFPAVFLFFSQAIGLNKVGAFRSWSHHMNEWDHGSNREVDQVIGAFFFVRRAVFNVLRGFDERFFVYFEEVDFSYRARQIGWRSVYLAGAQAFHAGGGTSENVKARRLFYSLRSRLLYALKHFSIYRALLLALITLLIEPVPRAIFSLLRGGAKDFQNTLRGYGLLLQKLPIIFRDLPK